MRSSAGRGFLRYVHVACSLAVAMAVTANALGHGADAGAPLPRVRVRNIGLHIGGGPNDAATKAPFLRRIALSFDAFRRCYADVEPRGRKGTFGIDLLVPKQGGHAGASNPRTGLGGVAFRECVVKVFEGIDFEPPRHGATKLSYALSFEPG